MANETPDPDDGPDDGGARFDALLAAGDFAAAEALIDAAYPDGVFGIDESAAGHFYDGWGDDAVGRSSIAEARTAYEKALGAYRQYASWATSGSEGLGRMVDVDRVQAKLAALEER